MSTKAYSSYTIIDVVDGMQWQPDATSHPANPQEGWAYYNTAERKSYLYDGEKWVVFAKDGASVKKINTHVRNFSLQRWQTYGEAGHEENWTTGADYDNSHINIGDTAYLIGTISDVVGAGGLPAEAMLYGIVTQVVQNHVRMTSSHVITGGANGANGKDGADFEETVQYCQHGSYSTAPESGWADTFPASWDNSKPYVWRRTKKVWNQKDESGTVKTTYTSPELISQLEVATIMAKDAGMTLDDWCVENDVTVISGSQIATGTLTADHVDVGGDLIAFGATIGGWDITEDAIEHTNGTTTIGLYSGGEEYDSLTASETETTSPIRLKCSGALVQKTMTFSQYVDGQAGEWTHEFDTDADVRDIVHCTCSSSNVTVYACNFSNGKIYIRADALATEDVVFEVTYTTPGGFMLLEDGSLYAEAARIEGNIVATSGTFTGAINATSGTIGGLTISGEEILSESSNLAFLPNGLITADKLYLKNYFESSTVRTQKISGRNSNPAYLLLESEGTDLEDVTINISTSVIKQGNINFWGKITDEGQIDVVVGASKAFTVEQVIRVAAVYAHEDNSAAFRDILHTVVIPAGQTTASFSIKQLFRSTHNAEPCNFIFAFCRTQFIIQQPKSSSTSAIASSTNFVPLSSQQQSLGATDKVWNYIYRLNESNGSDRKIKDKISDIDDNFSKQLIEGLSPKSYIFKTAKTPRTHYGFIAQDVEELLHSLGTSADEVGIVCKSLPGEPDGENNYYGLNYTNLIAPMVSVIQQLSKRVEELENKLNTKQND